ncbi:MAG: YiiX/YebB-like N1pC/P60 family cysteine hydrolase [Candidatus Thiodiazotropha endolucinida]|nr:protein tyrosine phosphatase [Candidatus Thiodiazotropha taylori]MCG8094495.1 protein tyrosine phosphatase [Candidatus Thiodiazotropha endolucinida]MCG8059558.1 protein tyrosine phosphatase [Candidatus Thiodiazotropha taylori]MCG8064296.1 protein tyrosine phosphatase [Candidatus Thiodiazotropha taylori]MCG8072092.1 protein tyrosine phosphatase [Candidatus Thiodiazotropha taylori]
MKKPNRSILLLLLISAVGQATLASPSIETSLQQQLINDRDVVFIQRNGLADTLRYMGLNGDLFPPARTSDNRLVNRAQRQKILSTWISFLDRLIILDSISQSYAGYEQHHDERVRKMAFRIAYAAFLARYRYVLDFLQITERNAQFHTLLNEPIPELGLKHDTYAEVKYHYLNIAIATEFARLALAYRLHGEEPGFRLNQGIRQDQAKIWDYGRGKGIKQTIKNGVQIVKDSSFKALFPIQKGISQWMGDVRVRRPHQSLITLEQVRSLQSRLEPGDILLERREWYLSNIGLPGFWPHAALFIGTPEQRQRYFQSADIKAWVRQQGVDSGEFEALLQHRYPEAYAESLGMRENDFLVRVIEAVSEGVVFTSLEHSSAADSLAVLRPRLSRLDKAKAILQAFHYSGRPYDFNFDFITDRELVCTELVYKAYEANGDKAGLTLPVVEILGRLATPANEIVKQFDQNYDTHKQQLDLVLFLDGQEKTGIALESDLATFRHSWRRPKWHILIQESSKTAHH